MYVHYNAQYSPNAKGITRYITCVHYKHVMEIKAQRRRCERKQANFHHVQGQLDSISKEACKEQLQHTASVMLILMWPPNVLPLTVFTRIPYFMDNYTSKQAQCTFICSVKWHSRDYNIENHRNRLIYLESSLAHAHKSQPYSNKLYVGLHGQDTVEVATTNTRNPLV